MPPVQCCACGFLGVVLRDTRQLIEAEDATRQTGGLPGGRHALDLYPVCFKHAADLRAEIDAVGKDPVNGPSNQWRIEVIQKLRECDRFFSWQRGFSPKEHAEMLREQEYREWQERQAEAQRRSANLSLGVAIVGIVVAVGGTIIAALINLAGKLLFK